MTIRTFIFCDICNPQGLRSIEHRRAPRELDRNGRRISDGRSWVEGVVTSAIESGWIETIEGLHICPNCKASYTSAKQHD